MCTAITAGENHRYFGRNLDFEEGFGERIVITPRQAPLEIQEGKSHYAMIGMALIQKGYPLYFDATNEHGLSMAGLLFSREAYYTPPNPKKKNIPSYGVIPEVLSQCKNAEEAKEFLRGATITREAFSEELPPSPLHWMMGDRENTFTVEQTKEGLLIHDNPVGVLTNSPAFPFQMEHLNLFLGLSPKEPKNRFSPELHLTPPGRGMGTRGLPGDLSSPSRFVRGCFHKMNAIWCGKEAEDVNRFFHLLDTVYQTMGCNQVGQGWEITRYSSCCNREKGIYYYTTHHNRGISAVDLFAEDLEGKELISYPLLETGKITFQNK